MALNHQLQSNLAHNHVSAAEHLGPPKGSMGARYKEWSLRVWVLEGFAHLFPFKRELDGRAKQGENLFESSVSKITKKSISPIIQILSN
jgi:hypothetical protein